MSSFFLWKYWFLQSLFLFANLEKNINKLLYLRQFWQLNNSFRKNFQWIHFFQFFSFENFPFACFIPLLQCFHLDNFCLGSKDRNRKIRFLRFGCLKKFFQLSINSEKYNGNWSFLKLFEAFFPSANCGSGDAPVSWDARLSQLEWMRWARIPCVPVRSHRHQRKE